MAKFGMEKMDSLCYDGTTPMFNLQAIVNDWSDEDKLKYFPFFLKGSATSVFDKLTAKTTIVWMPSKVLKTAVGPTATHTCQCFRLEVGSPDSHF
jgi:hypothetical protein